MSDPFIGEIRMFAGTFAPRGWTFCAGQQLSISENSTLFAILGTTYGGDGRVSFNLPDLRGRVPVGAMGRGIGVTQRPLGSMGGREDVILDESQLAEHAHSINSSGASAQFSGTPVDATVTLTPKASASDADVSDPSGAVLATTKAGRNPTTAIYKKDSAPSEEMQSMTGTASVTAAGNVSIDLGGMSTSTAGNSVPHENMQPWLAMNYIIAVQGVFPPRN